MTSEIAGRPLMPPPLPDNIDLLALSDSQLDGMAAAARQLRECRRRLAGRPRGVIGELANDHLYPYTHYPRGDVYDFDSHAQYYFHLHRSGEDGHFHTFLRPQGMPLGIRPADAADWRGPGDNDALSHLVAIAVDHQGEARGLFTTNRWVTAETWYRAADVIAMLPCFTIAHGRPSQIANDWICALMALFRPQIEALLIARDARLADHCSRESGIPAAEDRDLEITSRMPIDVESQIARLLALRPQEGVMP